MKLYKDREGREWTIDVHVDAIKRVKALLGVDLLELVGDGGLIERLIGDPVLLCDVVYVLCKPQADQRGISDQDFGRAMGGDSIDGATTALLEDLCDFFPGRKRLILQTALAKLRMIESRMLDLAEQQINDPALDQSILMALDKLGRSSIAMPQSAASPLDLALYAN